MEAVCLVRKVRARTHMHTHTYAHTRTYSAHMHAHAHHTHTQHTHAHMRAHTHPCGLKKIQSLLFSSVKGIQTDDRELGRWFYSVK